MREKPKVDAKKNLLRDEITNAINRYSAENGSDTPDFILGQYLLACLDAFDAGVNARDKWYERGRFDPNRASAVDGPVPIPKEE